jgi:O-antigen/teichoic acid export membrane protein
MSSALISGVASIYMAKNGFGVWTLVYQQIIFGIISTIILWFYSKWWPKLIFSWKSFKEMFSFGFNLLISGLIDTIYNNLYTVIIGKIFNATSLGYYSRADHYAQLPASNFNSIFFRVIYPVFCKMQDDDDKLRENYRKLLRVSAFIIFPIMCGLAGAAYPSVVMIIGKKWEYAAVLLVPICLAKMWFPIHAINLNILKVKGRTDFFLKLEIIKKIIGITIIVVSIPFGLLFMCYCQIVSSIISLFINTYYSGKLIQFGFWKQMKDISHILITSLSMFAIIRIMNLWIDNVYLQFILDVIVGIVFYFSVVFVFRFKEIEYIKSLRKKKNNENQSTTNC